MTKSEEFEQIITWVRGDEDSEDAYYVSTVRLQKAVIVPMEASETYGYVACFFESMAWGPDGDLEKEVGVANYMTEIEARLGHAKVVKALEKYVEDLDDQEEVPPDPEPSSPDQQSS